MVSCCVVIVVVDDVGGGCGGRGCGWDVCEQVLDVVFVGSLLDLVVVIGVGGMKCDRMFGL